MNIFLRKFQINKDVSNMRTFSKILLQSNIAPFYKLTSHNFISFSKCYFQKKIKLDSSVDTNTKLSDKKNLDTSSVYKHTPSKYMTKIETYNENKNTTFNDKTKFINTLEKKVMSQEENSLSFREFKLQPEIYNVLDSLNFHAPTDIQSVVIPKILEGHKHVFFASQTGTGKTLSYLLPLLNTIKLEEKMSKQRLTISKRPRALIIVPSRELAQQIEEVCKLFIHDLPLIVESFYVGKEFSKERELSKKGIDILITTPERFKNHWGKRNIYASKLSHIIIDELDTLLDSGNEEFIKEISSIILRRKKEEESGEENDSSIRKQLTLVTTTVTTNIESYVDELFKTHERLDYVKIINKSTNHNLSNVKHEFMHVGDYDKYPTLLKIINDNVRILKQNLAIMIFCNNVSCARRTEMFLAESGFSTACLHGDIPPLRRKFELEKFRKRRAQVLICTDLISRGLDFPFVYMVINFDFPKTLSDYLHRAGRTGRAGRRGVVMSFYRKNNLPVIEKIQKAHEMKTPLKIDNSMFSLWKLLPSQEIKNKLIKDKLNKGVSHKKFDFRKRASTKNELSLLKNMKERRDKLAAFKEKSNTIKNEQIRKLDLQHKRKLRMKNAIKRSKVHQKKKQILKNDK